MDGWISDGTQASFEGFVHTSTDQLLNTGYLIVWDLYTAQDLVIFGLQDNQPKGGSKLWTTLSTP
ncbi:MAG: hypothetical protein ACRDX8_14580 [Acidimicrobiales bacterium]